VRFLMRYWPLRAWWVFWLGLKNESPRRRPTEMEDGVWVGGVPLPRRWRVLQAAGVTRVVTLLGEASPAPWLRSAESLLWLPVPDNHAPTMEQLRRGCAFLDSARSSDGPATLISCGAGIGRASTLYLAWRMATGTPLERALDALRRRRPVVSPTRRQLDCLHQWGDELRG